MKKILFLTLLISAMSFAQNDNTVIVYSDDGENFTLSLNNVQQHEFPTNNVVITNLTDMAYGLKIVFENPNKPEFKKTLYLPEGANDITYKLIEKKGTIKMRIVSLTDYHATSYQNPNVVVMQYSPTPVFSQTTTTTTTTTGVGNSDNVSVGISVGGVDMDVNVNVNNGNSGTVTQTTTTTTTTGGTITTGGGVVVTDDHYVMDGYNGPYGCPWPMSPADFREALHTIQSKDWDDTKFSIAKQIVSANCLFADQVRDIMNLFEWEDKKLEFAKYAYHYTYDTGNYFKVAQAFEWESSIEELNEYISGH